MSTARPQVTPPQPWAFPVPTEHVLGNGVRVLLHDLPGQYVLSLRVVVPLAVSAEPAGQEGIASMTARLLDEGTASLGSDEFAELMERHGMVLGAGVSDGGLLVDVDVSQRHLATAAGLLTQALAAPAFPEDEVRRILRNRLAEIEQERASSAHRASKEFARTLWDPADRASRPTGGTPESIGALTRDDLVEFHATHVGPDGATVVVAGDLTDVDVLAVLEATLGTWSAPRHTPSARPVPPLPAADAARVVVVDRPGSVQTEIVVGRPGPDRSTPHGWAPHPVLSFVLGGSPSARIDAVLREEKGYTYGIRSTFRPRVAGGTFVTSGSVRSEVTGESVEILLGILDGARDGFTDAELRTGVDYVAMTAPGRYATADAVADESATLALEGLPGDFTTRNLLAVNALTLADLDAAYGRVVTGEWTVVLVGDAAQVVPQLDGRVPGSVSTVAL
ncbi:MAG TPA: pitrilysin family protein [Ornithinibacter sp.]|uniref:M16 family metallopeptidase n=1 Tax=Ornithinibacter sp. TaxID=2862748 RepID=UPI002CB9F868|nr:pitrilysin family protein [Ornithinibacter sp.]HQV82773.1 pitrilysin family protein [Ornithinibacter sp.]HQW72489.1 pitrilysin family protein [Ornithinibacter sp.]HQZ08840.1 pitrilysin family protein [Ornithinibacter sp.]HRA24859.1 pitrilysin family protein [Ornithinibacter sp.]